MPTENRSSNTELSKIVTEALVGMVSGVTGMKPPPGEPLPGFIQAPIDRAVTRISGLLTQPAQQPHPEPIAWMVGTAIWWTKEEAERDAAATGLPVTPVGTITESSKPAEQHQGEGVGEVVAFGEGLHEIAWSAGRMPKLGAKLYTSADHGEVERLRSIERSYGLREALLEQMKGERDRMIARTLELADQLANQDALLHKLKETLQREYWDEYAGLDETRELIDAALAASAETEATS
ncbi:hypothetical protein [Pseudomonas sp. 25571]|uniref:hypothetical protein n=1 Tax=Pseudomonas sp. 25571 TaxID=2967216 RepID=UPI002364687E|nr:hypothetical protein [Pseudomonas sp. 25571]MDD2063009.1 hypothetical protein [Pseudomonas sp. 25571]